MSGNTGTDIWIAGAFAAFTVDLLIYPLDTLKTRIQSPDYKKYYVDASKNTIKPTVLFRGLYQGLSSVIIATLPSSGAFFTTYEYSKSILNQINPPSPFVSSRDGESHPLLIPQSLLYSAASASAELVSCAILTPAEVIKQNAQMVSEESTRRTGSSATVQTLKKFRQNPLQLWRGYGALAGRNLPHTAIQFPLFEKFKVIFQNRQSQSTGQTGEISLYQHAKVTSAAAACSGAIAAVVTTPVDVVKTRIMLSAISESNSEAGENVVKDATGAVKDSAKQKKSGWAVGKEVVREQGWIGLMRGGGLRGFWTAAGMGLYLGMYETAKLYLERGHAQPGHSDD